MRKIYVSKITETVKRLCLEANFELPADIVGALRKGLRKETSSLGKDALRDLIRNIKIASREKIPICQDTGFVVVFVELGQNVKIVGGSMQNAINKGVRDAYKEGYLRKSIVKDPLIRINTKDNTPAVIHTEIVSGDRMRIRITPKGAGSENMSALAMLSPSNGINGIKRFVLDNVKKAGANPCPPIIVGIGIGGTFEKVAILAKKALFRTLGKKNKNKRYADLEKELVREINALGIGPEGFGGDITALAVHIEVYPCHIASLPVAINIGCYASRHKEAVI